MEQCRNTLRKTKLTGKSCYTCEKMRKDGWDWVCFQGDFKKSAIRDMPVFFTCDLWKVSDEWLGKVRGGKVLS